MPSQPLRPSITIPHFPTQTAGSLSLHEYRKNLSQTPSPDHTGSLKKLKRKNGALNLNQTQPQIRTPGWTWDPASTSSATSSPPPLSPSYSLSAMSLLSSEKDFGREMEGEGFEAGIYSPEIAAFQEMSTEYAVRARTGGNVRNRDTFRRRIEEIPQIHEPAGQEQSNNCSNSETGTRMDDSNMISHDGASFQILNPRNSLRLARIVSYIEDMDCPLDSTEARRDSCSIRDGEKGAIAEESSRDSSPTLQGDDEINPDDASQPNDTDLFDLLSHPSINKPSTENDPGDEETQKAHREIIGEMPNTPIPSISERLSISQYQYCHSHSASAPTLSLSKPYELPRHRKTNTEAGSPTKAHLDSGYQTEQVSPIYNKHGDFSTTMFFNHDDLDYSPHRDIFGSTPGLSSGYGVSMQDFHFWDQVEVGNMPDFVVKKEAGRWRWTKRTSKGVMPFTKERGGKRDSLLRPLRRLRDAVRAW
ncbi:hypothetical protein PHISCL_03498 [Aspergillus sclerotialis]|uniref:Uncharacterized protein n=1 Tax=Aspergillus sclerotialis TaxID=2070753 RepID=A0A3A2ZLU0_9EURO|nr:hypothetical protein PHISCL_03498 [Aspergillus sclerotialis]